MCVPEDLRLRRGREKRPERLRLGRRIMGLGDEFDRRSLAAHARPLHQPSVATASPISAASEVLQPSKTRSQACLQRLRPFDEGEQRLAIRGAVAAQTKRRADHRDGDRLVRHPVLQRSRRTESALELRDEIDGPVEGPQFDRWIRSGLRQRDDFRRRSSARTAQCREAAAKYWPGRAGGGDRSRSLNAGMPTLLANLARASVRSSTRRQASGKFTPEDRRRSARS